MHYHGFHSATVHVIQQKETTGAFLFNFNFSLLSIIVENLCFHSGML